MFTVMSYWLLALFAVIAIFVLWFILRQNKKFPPINGTVLITGGASGLGRAIALQLAKDPTCNLVLWDINEAKLRRFLRKLNEGREGKDARHFGQIVDVSCEDQVKAASKSLGNLVYVIGNAGICNGKSFYELDGSEFETTIRVNFLHNVYLTRHLYNRILPGGRLVFIASAAGLFSLTKLSDYCASKFALVGWSESLRLEMRNSRSPVRTTIVCPFLMDTKMFSGVTVKFPANLLLRTLNKHEVAKRVVQAMRAGEEFVFIPEIMRLTPLLLALPVSLRNIVYDIIGESHYMDTFRGCGDRWYIQHQRDATRNTEIIK